jgi:hypothetical protein
MKIALNDDVAKIRELLTSIIAAARRSLENGIRLGELLEKCKAVLPHVPWLLVDRYYADTLREDGPHYIRLFKKRPLSNRQQLPIWPTHIRYLPMARFLFDLKEAEVSLTEDGVAQSCETVAALLEIREQHLYRGDASLEEYCR